MQVWHEVRELAIQPPEASGKEMNGSWEDYIKDVGGEDLPEIALLSPLR